MTIVVLVIVGGIVLLVGWLTFRRRHKGKGKPVSTVPPSTPGVVSPPVTPPMPNPTTPTPTPSPAPTPTPAPPAPTPAPGPHFELAVLNESTVCTDAEIEGYVTAWQTQIDRDFSPAWGVTARLHFVPKGQNPDPSMPQVVVLDNSDQAGALGYHDLTATGQPLGKVFAGTDKTYGYKVSVTGSHEILELLADPNINKTWMTVDAQGTVGYAVEVCDPPESDSYGYDIGGVTVSDFVLPAYFGTDMTGPFDFEKRLTRPAPSVLPGGYISVWRPTTGWTQVNGEVAAQSLFSRAPVGSRRERRRVGEDAWLRSEPRDRTQEG